MIWSTLVCLKHNFAFFVIKGDNASCINHFLSDINDVCFNCGIICASFDCLSRSEMRKPLVWVECMKPPLGPALIIKLVDGTMIVAVIPVSDTTYSFLYFEGRGLHNVIHLNCI